MIALDRMIRLLSLFSKDQKAGNACLTALYLPGLGVEVKNRLLTKSVLAPDHNCPKHASQCCKFSSFEVRNGLVHRKEVPRIERDL